MSKVDAGEKFWEKYNSKHPSPNKPEGSTEYQKWFNKRDATMKQYDRAQKKSAKRQAK
jgi:hypothetical protein